MARRIAPLYGALVATPAYLAKHGTPTTLAEVAAHEAVIQGATTWRLHDGRREHTLSVHGRFESDSGEATLSAILAGVGLGMLPTFLAGEHIARGELTVLLQQYRIRNSGCTWCDHRQPRTRHAASAR